MGTLTVVCINWCNYLGRGEEYVSKLRNMVARNLTIPHRFECLTERELGDDLRGWWAKLRLFEPGRFAGPVLYFDLDVVITSSIDSLLETVDDAKLWARDDFSYPLRTPRKDLGTDMQQLLGGPGTINSSVMYFGPQVPVWERWQTRGTECMATMHGDQNALSALLGQDSIGFLPDSLVGSYKYNPIRGMGISPVMTFHGKPKPHEVRDSWVRQHWQ